MPLKLSPTQIAFNARGDGKFNKPFQEQIDFLKQKIDLPSERYDDIQKSAHDRAFMVAGAAKADLLNDLHDAINKAAAGESIQSFRKRFDEIVKKNGWEGWTGSDTKAGRDWRTRVIYQTNLLTSYSAGLYKQLNDPDLRKVRPYWKYIHNETVQHPRPLHVSWSGLVLHADDPWWQTHFPPNGYGCRCRVTAVRESEFKGQTAPDDGTYTHTDSHGNKHEVPNGIDFGFDYQPGANTSTPFKDLIDKKLINFPARLGADMWQALKPSLAMETQLQWTETLDEWLATPQTGRAAVVGAIDPFTLGWLAEQELPLPVTAEIAVREGLIRGSKQARHDKSGDGLTEAEWRQLPRMLSQPSRVLLDVRTGKLVYVMDTDDAGVKITVNYDYKKKGKELNMIVSGFRQSSKTIEERIKGKLYREIK